MAEQVRQRTVVGVAVYKPANSHPESEPRVFDFVGMLGIPLVPCHEFPSEADAGFFAVHALKDPELVPKLSSFIAAGKTTLVTDGLARQLTNQVDLHRSNVRILPVRDDPKSLLDMPQDELNALRQCLLAPFSTRFDAPHRVALYLFADGSWVVENFQDQPVSVNLNGQALEIGARGWKCEWQM